jgi:hypothetical protein
MDNASVCEHDSGSQEILRIISDALGGPVSADPCDDDKELLTIFVREPGESANEKEATYANHWGSSSDNCNRSEL